MTNARASLPGAIYLGNNRCRFRVWAPNARTIDLQIEQPMARTVALSAQPQGYFEDTVDGVEPGTRYRYRLDGEKHLPDPASRFQPDGVHNASAVVDPAFDWRDRNWINPRLADYLIYELHVGTFTPQGTFAAASSRLEDLVALGITAVEIMPVAQFPGSRNWGYDGVYPYAVQDSYGGTTGFKQFVDACHDHGLAVILDVVYNHLGPEGNYLSAFGPYFTNRYSTPWGMAMNFDGADSDEVRAFFIENALYWIDEFHVDALRLDATHAMLDFSAQPFLEELTTVVHDFGARQGRRVYLIAENDRNDARVVTVQELGGYELDAQWSDEFHHTLHTLLTGEHGGYYQDFGSFQQFVKAYREGFVYSGEYAPARGRRHGTSSRHLPAARFVICTENHDQVGNRMLGERTSELVDLPGLKLLAGALLLAPYIPLLFMGQEYGETAPFLYFVSHGDRSLIEAVRRGRREEFAAFAWQGEPPDPQAESTFERSRLDHTLRTNGWHAGLLALYTELIRCRKDLAAQQLLTKESMEVTGFEQELVVLVRHAHRDAGAFMIYNLGTDAATVAVPQDRGRWQKAIDSTDPRWDAAPNEHTGSREETLALPVELSPGAPTSLRIPPRAFVVYTKAVNA